MPWRGSVLWIGLAVFGVGGIGRTAEEAPGSYLKAPEEIRKILDLPPAPLAGLTPAGDHLLLADWQRYPAISEFTRPVARLAGLRIDTRANAATQSTRLRGMSWQPLNGGKPIPLALPANARPRQLIWAPDGKQFALLTTTPSSVLLSLGVAGQAELREVKGLRVNAALGDIVRWLPDSRSLICQAVPAGRGAAPPLTRTPTGPVIQEGSGKPAPVRTYQDLLRNAHDETRFDYYCTAQLVVVDAARLTTRPLGPPGIFAALQPSPEGKYLLVSHYHRPYSYVVPASAFPRRVEVWNAGSGAPVHLVADLPLADAVPIEGVPTGPRQVRWRPDRPATLVWVSALDDGDPAKKVRQRDQLWSLAEPFSGKPTELARTEQRFAGLLWSDNGFALLSDYDRDNRRQRTYLIRPDSGEAPRLIWDHAVQDRYNDPGTPLMTRTPSGQSVLRRDGDVLFLTGAGASPQGDRPTLDRFDLKTKKMTRLFQSAAGAYEVVLDLLPNSSTTFLTRHESPTSPPNYRLREVGKLDFRAVTSYADPAPQLRRIRREIVRYKRDDGVPLSFTLYLPPDHKPGIRLPTVVWAYPREYNDPSVAGQVVGSPDRYTALVGPSHLFFLLAGYAVLDGATMPVVGPPEKANDTFVEQIVASARAAIARAEALGVTDPRRVGVGGHSYGAFMTANLLAHSDLFRAGIARSGAYNRTLTPFGFQNERRTLWQAPAVYTRVSPLLHADKINEPLLLIHGESDNNSGTFPMQSERLFQAMRGTGGTVRYVSLPYESHGYSARESVEHTLAEMIGWFDRHVKPVPAAPK